MKSNCILKHLYRNVQRLTVYQARGMSNTLRGAASSRARRQNICLELCGCGRWRAVLGAGMMYVRHYFATILLTS